MKREVIIIFALVTFICASTYWMAFKAPDGWLENLIHELSEQSKRHI